MFFSHQLPPHLRRLMGWLGSFPSMEICVVGFKQLWWEGCPQPTRFQENDTPYIYIFNLIIWRGSSWWNCRRSLPWASFLSQLLSELRWLRWCIHSTAQLRTAHKKPSWKHGQHFLRWDSLLKSSKTQKEKHRPITVTEISLVLLLSLLVVVVVVLVVAVVLLLSLFLISRSSGDNYEKNSWQFSGVFSGFLCSFLKVHLSKARRVASTLPPNFSQNSSRSRAWNDLDVNPLMSWKHIGGINNFRTFKWNWLVS